MRCGRDPISPHLNQKLHQVRANSTAQKNSDAKISSSASTAGEIGKPAEAQLVRLSQNVRRHQGGEFVAVAIAADRAVIGTSRRVQMKRLVGVDVIEPEAGRWEVTRFGPF